MKSGKSIFTICAINFRKWQTDYRIWCIAVLLAVLTAIYVDDMRKSAELIGAKIPIWIFPFLYSQFHTKLIFMLGVVLMFCNAPFADKNQMFVFMRSGRIKWLCGQILYIVFASAAYFLFLLIISLLFTVFTGELSLEWGKTLSTLSANSSLHTMAGANFVDISEKVITFFKPLQAVWFTFLMSWLGGIFLGLLIYLCNFLTGNRLIGILASSFLVVICSIIENEGWEKLLPISPISWTTLDNIDVGGLSTNPSFTYCICFFVGIIAALIATILFFGRKKSVDIKEG